MPNTCPLAAQSSSTCRRCPISHALRKGTPAIVQHRRSRWASPHFDAGRILPLSIDELRTSTHLILTPRCQCWPSIVGAASASLRSTLRIEGFHNSRASPTVWSGFGSCKNTKGLHRQMFNSSGRVGSHLMCWWLGSLWAALLVILIEMKQVKLWNTKCTK